MGDLGGLVTGTLSRGATVMKTAKAEVAAFARTRATSPLVRGTSSGGLAAETRIVSVTVSVAEM